MTGNELETMLREDIDLAGSQLGNCEPLKRRLLARFGAQHYSVQDTGLLLMALSSIDDKEALQEFVSQLLRRIKDEKEPDSVMVGLFEVLLATQQQSVETQVLIQQSLFS